MGEESSTCQRGPDSGRALTRRKVFTGGVVAAAVGATGSVLATATARPAAAAVQATIVESGAVVPAVVNLADAASIAVDASLGNDFRVTIAGNRSMNIPTNPSDGQQIVIQVTQGPGGSFMLTWASGYEFSADLPQPTLSTNAGQTDLLGFIYNSAKDTWLFAAYVNGFD
jgi:hypothetical protein